MPIYEYSCTACGHQFDAMQRIVDDPLLTCPKCDKPALTKLVSAAGFRLKGGGWYETDFKQGDKKNVAHAESEKSSDKQTDAVSKTETSSDTSSTKEVKKTPEASSTAPATTSDSKKGKEKDA